MEIAIEMAWILFVAVGVGATAFAPLVGFGMELYDAIADRDAGAFLANLFGFLLSLPFSVLLVAFAASQVLS